MNKSVVNQSVLATIKAKSSRKRKCLEPLSTKVITIDGKEYNVPLFPETGRRPSQSMKTRGKQQHDAKITAHLSTDDLKKY